MVFFLSAQLGLVPVRGLLQNVGEAYSCVVQNSKRGRETGGESASCGWNALERKRPIWEKIDPPRAWAIWFNSAFTLPDTHWELSEVFLMN